MLREGQENRVEVPGIGASVPVLAPERIQGLDVLRIREIHTGHHLSFLLLICRTPGTLDQPVMTVPSL